MSLCTTNGNDDEKGTLENPFRLKKGITFTIISRVKGPDKSPVDLTGYTGRAELRRQAADVGPPIATFTVVIHPTEVGRADAEIGAVDSATNGDLQAGVTYIFDIEHELDADPQKVITGGEGFVHVVDGVTKS